MAGGNDNVGSMEVPDIPPTLAGASQATIQENPSPAAQPGQPHAGLVNMLQGLFLGLDAFAKSAATGGREGGATEVIQAQRAAIQQKMQQQQQAQEMKESNVRIQHTQAVTNQAIAQTQILQHDAPLEYQTKVIENQKALADLYQNVLHIPAAFIVPIMDGQGTDEHMQAINSKANGDLVNNTVIPVHDDKFGGAGNSIGMAFDALRKTNLTLDQAAPAIATLQNQIDLAKGMLGADDPAVKVAQGKIDLLKQGQTINGWDFYNFNQQVQAQLMSKVANKQAVTEFQTKQTELQQKQQEVAAAARPKNLDDATGRLVAAQQAFKTSPTPENKLAVDAANVAVKTFQRVDAQQAASKAYATKTAELNAMDANDAKNAPALIDAAKNYQLDPEKLYGLRGQQRANFLTALLKQDPTWNLATYKARFDTQQDFSPKGKSGQQVEALNTFAGHASDAMQLVDSLRNSGSPLINKPLNEVAVALGNDKVQPFQAAMMAAKDEYLNFLKAGHAATKEEIERVEKLGSDSSTPAQIQAVLKQMSNTVLVRAASLNHQYKATMGKDYPDMFSPEGAQAMADLGHPEVTKFGISGGQLPGKPFNPATELHKIQ